MGKNINDILNKENYTPSNDKVVCFPAKIGLSDDDKDKMSNAISDKVLLKTANGSPDEKFADLESLLARYQNGRPVDFDYGYQRPKLVANPSGTNNVYIYSRVALEWIDAGLYMGGESVVKLQLNDLVPNSVDTIMQFLVTKYTNLPNSQVLEIEEYINEVEMATGQDIIDRFFYAYFSKVKNRYGFLDVTGFDLVITNYIDYNIKFYVLLDAGEPHGYRIVNEINDYNFTQLDKNAIAQSTTDISNIKEEQITQNKQIKNHTEEIAEINDIIRSTIVTPVLEEFEPNYDIPTTINVEGTSYSVVDNQKSEVASIKGVSRKSKNIIPFPYFNGNSEINGITYEIKDDGTVVFNGTSTDYFIFKLVEKNYASLNKLLNFDGVVSFKSYGSTFRKGITMDILSDVGANVELMTRYQSSATFNTLEYPSQKFNSIRFVIDPGITVTNFTIKPMLSKGKNLLPYEPYYSGLKSSTIKNVESWSPNLANWKPLVEGKDINNIYIHDIISKPFVNPKNLSGTKYVVSSSGATKISGAGDLLIKAYFKDKTSQYISLNTVVILSSKEVEKFEFSYSDNANYNLSNFQLQIEKGSQAHSYTPYGVIDETLNVNATLKGTGTANDEIIVTENINGLFDVKKVTRMAEVDLSTLTWQPHPSISNIYEAALTDKKNGINNFISANYTLNPVLVSVMGEGDIRGEENGNKIVIKLASGNPTGKLVYELATPTETTIATDLTLADISVLAKQGGRIKTNTIAENDILPSKLTMQYDVKYWIK